MKSDKIVKCPSDEDPQKAPGSEDLAHSYGINYALTYNSGSGAPFVYKMSGVKGTSDLLLFFEMKSSAQTMGSSYYISGISRMETRHGNRCGVGFLDGHGKMLLPQTTLKPVNMWLPS